MRVTKTDGCCGPEYGDDNSIVTDGFVSVALTANITDAEEITVTNANGKTCVRDAGSPTFDGYGVEITFCEVQPCLFSMITGQPVVLDDQGEIVGFKMNSGITLDQSGFALEVWMGVPGVACEGDAGAYGYLLLPCLQGGVIGDFTIENAAITFTITGASTKDGNGWGSGPYADTVLPEPLDEDDHLYVIFTTVDPPEPSDGCEALLPPGLTLEVVDPDATLTLPRASGDPCWDGDVIVDWGDGSAPETIAAPVAEALHTYTANGSYDVDVSTTVPDCPSYSFPVIIASIVPPTTTAAAAARKAPAKAAAPAGADSPDQK